MDPDPESKPARPDTIDLDEDEKEMLSEARARLANTQGKKAKRKARERQLEESRRLAVLQKRRELKSAGINVKVVTTKKGEMDYNADIPFEKAPAPGFYDTTEEQARNERQREMFDPRKIQLAGKRKGEQDEEAERKKRKSDKNSTFAAAAKAGRMQKIREAEQMSKRRPLNLPAPQVSESELEDIVKMGLAGDRAAKMAGEENDNTRGLVGNYSTIVGGTPIRTPQAPPQEDHIANEIHNIKALTETQSSLLGGENAPLHEGPGSTGFEGITPRKQDIVTPNPMATPFRQAAGGAGATPIRGGIGPGATPLRTPRDQFALNKDAGGQIVGATPREIKIQENLMRRNVRSQLASLPKPKETEWELEELPSESPEPVTGAEAIEEDAAERDRRNAELRRKQAEAEFRRQTQVIQKSLPRPSSLNVTVLLERASQVTDPIERLIAEEAAILIANDARKHPVVGAKVEGKAPAPGRLDDAHLEAAREAIAKELDSDDLKQRWQADFESSWTSMRDSGALPGLGVYEDEEDNFLEQEQRMIDMFDHVQEALMATAEQGNKLEKKLALHYGGYQARAKTLRSKIVEASAALEKAKIDLDTFRTLQIAEDGALSRRLEKLRDEVSFITRREREAQELYRSRKEELEAHEAAMPAINGAH